MTNITHNMTGTPEYKTWDSIKTRIKGNHKNYGGRGIKMCERWWHKFENFYEDMGKRPSGNHSIDRINVNGNYCKENCRWALPKEQARNRRNNVLYSYGKDTMTLPEFSEKYGISIRTLKSRIYKNRNMEIALNFKPKNYRYDRNKNRFIVRFQRKGIVIQGGSFRTEKEAQLRVEQIIEKL